MTIKTIVATLSSLFGWFFMIFACALLIVDCINLLWTVYLAMPDNGMFLVWVVLGCGIGLLWIGNKLGEA